MRVLLISHTCQSQTEGQLKPFHIASDRSIEMQVLVPHRWFYNREWRSPEVPNNPPYKYVIGKVSMPWVGPAQWYLHWYPALGKLLKEVRPDIIDLWEEPWGFVSAHTCMLRNRLLPGAKVISETEQNINKNLPAPFEQFRSYVLRNADFVIARSSEALSVTHAKGYKGLAEVVPNAVNTELFHPMDRAACRRKLGLTGFTVGYVGRLVPEKGITELLEAIASAGPEVNGLIVGSGPMEEELKAQARALGCHERIQFVGPLPAGEVAVAMNAVDVLAVPSRTTPRWKEQYGRVIIEAHACETPVIGTDSGAIPRVIGEGGIVVPEQQPAALRAAIDRLRKDPNQRKHMGCEGRMRVEAETSGVRVAQQMCAIYHRLYELKRG